MQAVRPAGQAPKATKRPVFGCDDPAAYEGMDSNPLRVLLRAVSRRVVQCCCTLKRSPAPTDAETPSANRAMHAPRAHRGRPRQSRWRSGNETLYQHPDGVREGCGERDMAWSCPLTAPEEMLPEDAKLEGNVLCMGAKPNMCACRLGRPGL
jgi:hypothetical protein